LEQEEEEKRKRKKREMRLKNVSLDVNEADKENNNQLTNYVINSFFFTLFTRFLSVRLSSASTHFFRFAKKNRRTTMYHHYRQNSFGKAY
jgi:hypothetical protein